MTAEHRPPIRAMVMAAGAGTRLRPLTASVPKPMVPIANRPVLEYTVENLRKHGIREIVMNLHSHPQAIRDYFRDGRDWGVKIEYSWEPELLGTAGGVKKVEPFLKGGTFLVMSGDGLTDINLTRLLDFHRRKKAYATVALKSVDSRFDYGVTLTDKNGAITRFIEKPRWSDVFSSQVNTGIYVLEPPVLSEIPTGKSYDFGNDLWPKLLRRKKRLFALPIEEYWCDVGNLHEYRRAQKDALDGAIRLRFAGRQVKKGVWMDEGSVLDRGVTLEGPALIGKRCSIASGTRIGPSTIIGENTWIGRGVVLNNCVLWNNVRVDDRVVLENCVIGHDAHVSESISVFEGAVIHIDR